MIKAEDIRIGDLVQTNKDCMFSTGTFSMSLATTLSKL